MPLSPGSIRRLPENALTPVIWTVSNLARTGPALQNQLRDAGALQWLTRVMHAGGGLGGDGMDGGGGGAVDGEEVVKAEVAAVLAAVTNLANGNSANQSRLRGEEGLMEALTAGGHRPIHRGPIVYSPHPHVFPPSDFIWLDRG